MSNKKNIKTVDEQSTKVGIPENQLEIPFDETDGNVVEYATEFVDIKPTSTPLNAQQPLPLTQMNLCCDGECKCSNLRVKYTKLVKHILNSSKIGSGALIGGIQINTLPKTGEYIVNTKEILDYDGLVEYMVDKWINI